MGCHKVYVLGQGVRMLLDLVGLDVGYREGYSSCVGMGARRLAEFAGVRGGKGTMAFGRRGVGRVDLCQKIEGLQVDVEDGRRFIAVYVFKRYDKVGWEDGGGISTPENTRLSLDGLFAPQAGFLVDLKGILCVS